MKAILLRSLSMLTLVFLWGCASAPVADVALDAEAKKFVPSPDKATIFIRSEKGGPFQIRLDDRYVGTVKCFVTVATYQKLTVPPGPHTITVSSSDTITPAATTITAEAGKKYFFKLKWVNGWPVRVALDSEPEEEGARILVTYRYRLTAETSFEAAALPGLSPRQREVFAAAKSASVSEALTGGAPFGSSPLKSELRNVLEVLGVNTSSGDDVRYEINYAQTSEWISGTLQLSDKRFKIPPYGIAFRCPVTKNRSDALPNARPQRIGGRDLFGSTTVVSFDMGPFRAALETLLDEVYGAGSTARAQTQLQKIRLAAALERRRQNAPGLGIIKTYKVGSTPQSEFLGHRWGDASNGMLGVMKAERARAGEMEYTMGWYESGPGSVDEQTEKFKQQLFSKGLRPDEELNIVVAGAAQTVLCILRFHDGVLQAVDWR